MNKPTLLYASPFPPMKSGISDYSVILVNALASRFDITLYTDNYDIEDDAVSSFPVVKHGVDKVDFDSFDYVLYNMGNNCDFHRYIYEAALKYPATVIHHDLSIYNFIYSYYKYEKDMLYSGLYRDFGIDVFMATKRMEMENTSWIDVAARYPLYDELIKAGNRFIVHSEYARNGILSSGLIDDSKVEKINLIDQMADDEKFVKREELYGKYGVPQDAFVIIALGNIIPTKKNIETCKAVKSIAAKTDKKVCYVMVGEGKNIDDYLEDNLIIKTGYTELCEFNSFIKYADVVVNLRYPSMGETSAAIIRSLKLGKPVVTNNGGWFTELPSDVVAKIDLVNIDKNIEDKLMELITDEGYRNQLSSNAAEYIEKEHSKSVIAEKMYKFITGE